MSFKMLGRKSCLNHTARLVLFLLIVLMVLIGGLVMWLNRSTIWMERHLNVQWRIEGEGSGNATITSFSARVDRDLIYGGGKLAFSVSALLHNRGEQDLEITQISLKFIDTQGYDSGIVNDRSLLTYPSLYYNNLPRTMGQMLPAGGVQAVQIGSYMPLHESEADRFNQEYIAGKLTSPNLFDILHMILVNISPSSIAWKDAIITVTVQPADPRISAWYQTWTDRLVITDAEPIKNNKNFYHVEGYVKGYDEIVKQLETKYNQAGSSFYQPTLRAVIGYYDSDGNFLAYDTLRLDVPPSGEKGGQFAYDYWLGKIPHGKTIADVKPLILELSNETR